MGQKIKILHKIRFNQEIMTKVFTKVHQLSINLVCSSDYQTAYSFYEIKHFVKQAKSLRIHFQELPLENITQFITSFLVVKSSINYAFCRFDLSLLEEKI